MDGHLRELAAPTEAANNIVNLWLTPAQGEGAAQGPATNSLATAGLCVKRECGRGLCECLSMSVCMCLCLCVYLCVHVGGRLQGSFSLWRRADALGVRFPFYAFRVFTDMYTTFEAE